MSSADSKPPRARTLAEVLGVPDETTTRRILALLNVPGGESDDLAA